MLHATFLQPRNALDRASKTVVDLAEARSHELASRGLADGVKQSETRLGDAVARRQKCDRAASNLVPEGPHWVLRKSEATALGGRELPPPCERRGCAGTGNKQKL